MVKKCLFPVAGYGTRFLPATKAQPKEMLPILTKPLIQYGVEEAAEAGMRNISFVTGRNKRAIEDHFDITYELEDQIRGTIRENRLESIRGLINECTYAYTRQIRMAGLGDAILCAQTIIGNEPFGVILADDLCVGDDGIMSQMIKVFEQYQCSVIAVEEIPHEDVSKYGIISGTKLDDQITQVETLVEKPSPDQAPSNLAIIGRYILTPDIFDILRNTEPGAGGEVQITDALQTQARNGGKVIAYKFKGRRFDCGSIEGFVDATNFFFQRLKENE